jgi:hypothetical protein
MFVLLGTALAGSPDALQAVQAFVRAGDERDVASLERVLHDDFRVVVRMPDGLSVMSRDLYVKLVTSGKIGGTPRTADFDVVMLSDDLATVKGSLDSSAAHFDCTWTVANGAAGWQVIQDAVVFAPKG